MAPKAITVTTKPYLRLTGIYLLITERCQGYCPHCCVNATEEGKDFNPEEAKRLISETADFGVKRVNIYGGEPLLYDYKSFLKIIELCASKGLEIIISTNGFWGGIEDFPDFLSDLNKIARKYKRSEIELKLSYDSFHKKIETDAVANIIAKYFHNSYDSFALSVDSFRNSESIIRVEKELIPACLKKRVTQHELSKLPLATRELLGRDGRAKVLAQIFKKLPFYPTSQRKLPPNHLPYFLKKGHFFQGKFSPIVFLSPDGNIYRDEYDLEYKHRGLPYTKKDKDGKKTKVSFKSILQTIRNREFWRVGGSNVENRQIDRDRTSGRFR